MRNLSGPFAFIVIAALFFASCAKPSVDYTAYVDPFIGTGGHGHTFPGPVVPYGMIQPGPDTRINGWDACSGYHYSDSTINGFSHTHLSGTGCGDFGDILLMPFTGVPKVDYQGPDNQRMAYASKFSHKNETARPGYYSVQLDTYGVKVELSATARAAIHRYTFQGNPRSGVIIDLDYSLQNQRNSDMFFQVISPTEVIGGKKTAFWAWDQYIYFYAKFSKPFTYETVSDSVKVEETGAMLQRRKLVVSFPTEEGEQIMVKVGISAVDAEGAMANAKAEIPDWDFAKVESDAVAQWNEYLGKIDVETSDEAQKKIFYTALYHTAIAPFVFSDVDGRYRGMDTKVHNSNGEPVYTIFSLWDTFRALHPLMTVIDPAKNNEFIRSLIQKHREGGVLPMWELAGNYTATMIGYHAVPVIVDAYMKGYRDFDVQEAFRACLKTSSYDTTGIVAPEAMKHGLMPMSKYYKNTLGYVPCDKEHEAVAKALEYAYNDWCIAQMAKELGDTANYTRYTGLGKAYRNYFDPSTRFMRGKDSNGKWRTPFSPRSSNHRSDDYCEGNAWQWTWFVPHDIEGLQELMGGREAFIAKLDSLFSADPSLEGELVSADISGLIGQYAHGNEPSHHIIHMYNYVGQPWKTQELADSVLRWQYHAAPDGLSGNEDCGQMSAWYILNSMGFYQVCPGDPVYSIGRPMMDRVQINLPEGKKFVIVAKNNSPANKYIKSATLNGKKLDALFLSHNDIAKGGELTLEMTNIPQK